MGAEGALEALAQRLGVAARRGSQGVRAPTEAVSMGHPADAQGGHMCPLGSQRLRI